MPEVWNYEDFGKHLKIIKETRVKEEDPPTGFHKADGTVKDLPGLEEFIEQKKEEPLEKP